MSSQKIQVQIEICSNCKSHQWCTRHKQQNYSALALDTKRLIQTKDPSIDVQIFQVGGTAMGSFQIICKGVVLFSKLGLGYFPHVPSAVTRVIQFVDDFRNGRDLKKYSEARSISPHKTMLSSASNGFKQKSVTSSPKITVKRVKYDPNSQPAKKEDQSHSKEKKQIEETAADKNPPKNNEQENHKQKKEESMKNKQTEKKESQKQIPTENKQLPKQTKKQSNKNIPNHSQKDIKNEKDINGNSNKHIPSNQSNQIKPEQAQVKQQQIVEANFILKQEQKQLPQSQPQPLDQSPNQQKTAEVPKKQPNEQNPNNEKVSTEKQEEVPSNNISVQNQDKKIE